MPLNISNTEVQIYPSYTQVSFLNKSRLFNCNNFEN